MTRTVPELGSPKLMDTKPVERVCNRDTVKTTEGCAYLARDHCHRVSCGLNTGPNL